VARGLHSRFGWIATAVGRRVEDDDLLVHLKHAGLVQVAIGAESGPDDLLARITHKTTARRRSKPLAASPGMVSISTFSSWFGYSIRRDCFEDWSRFDYLQPNLLGMTADYMQHVNRFQKFLIWGIRSRVSEGACRRPCVRLPAGATIIGISTSHSSFAARRRPGGAGFAGR
jgi:hypothetical protein